PFARGGPRGVAARAREDRTGWMRFDDRLRQRKVGGESCPRDVSVPHGIDRDPGIVALVSFAAEVGGVSQRTVRRERGDERVGLTAAERRPGGILRSKSGRGGPAGD